MKVVFLVAIVSSLVDAEVSEDAAAAAAGAEDPLASLDAQWEDEFGLEVTTTAPYFTDEHIIPIPLFNFFGGLSRQRMRTVTATILRWL